MARIRTVKPEFWTHPIMGKVDDAAKCMALALLNFSDDEGFFLADANLVRSYCRPFDDDSTIARRCLDTLVVSGWIEVKDSATHGSIGLVVNFKEHQKIDRPKPSNLKVYFIDDQSTIVRRKCSVGMEGNGREGKIEANASIVVAEAVTVTDNTNGKQADKDESKAKRTRRNREEILVPYGENVRKVVNSVLSPGFWPKADPDGRVIVPDPSLLCANVALIFTDHPQATPELLIQAAKCYTAKDKTRFCAPQFFFGRGKAGGDAPHWIAEYRMAVHQAQRKAEQEQARLEAEAMGAAS